MKIKKDDQVKILSGKDAGKTGKVQQVFPKHSKIIVEGISLTKGAKQAIENAGGKVVDLEKKNNKDIKDKSNSEDND